MPLCSFRVRMGCVFGTALVMFVFGLVFGLVVRQKVDEGLKTASQVCDDSDWLTNFKKDDPAKYKMYYGFNITNPEAYLKQTEATPAVADMVGPFAIRQFETNFDVEYSKDKKTVQYRQLVRSQYEPSKSCDGCNEWSKFTNLNPALLNVFASTGGEWATALVLSNLEPNTTSAQGYNLSECNEASIGKAMNPTSDACDPTTDNTCCCNRDLTSLTDPRSCLGRANTVYTTLARIDGGYEFDHAAGGKVVTPLLMTKTAHEVAYGYPGVMAGLLVNMQRIKNKVELDKVAAAAKYTELVKGACSRNLTEDGYAPLPDSPVMQGMPWQYLGGINCRYLEGVQYFAQTPIIGDNRMRCEILGGEAGIAACMCLANMNKTTSLQDPCCTAAGFGCLEHVTGYVTDRFFIDEAAVKEFTPDDVYVMNTGCGDFKDDSDFWWSTYYSRSESNVWAKVDDKFTPPTREFVNQVRADASLYTYNSTTLGGDGTRFKGTGRTSKMFSKDLSDGQPNSDVHTVYITQVLRPTLAKWDGKSERLDGVLVNRFKPDFNFLDQNATAVPDTKPNLEVGAGTPFSGVTDVTYEIGFPTYVSRPLFLSNEDALTQNGQLKLTENGEEITPEQVTADRYDTYLLVEPASGMTLSAHKRLMASFALWKCSNPLTEICFPLNNYGVAGAFTPTVPGGVVIPQYYMDETATATKKNLDDLKLVASLHHSAELLLVVMPVLGAVVGLVGVGLCVRGRRSTAGLDRTRLL